MEASEPLKCTKAVSLIVNQDRGGHDSQSGIQSEAKSIEYTSKMSYFLQPGHDLSSWGRMTVSEAW